jgi:EAL domain-containing protein (putative c-di-GMP-specific phosphodiesterase class I)
MPAPSRLVLAGGARSSGWPTGAAAITIRERARDRPAREETMAAAILSGHEVTDDRWLRAVTGLLARPDGHALVLQPVVDLARGVVAGYEALSRFSVPPSDDPAQWFTAAGRVGWGGQLEALVLRRALELRALLPADRFLTVNLSPRVLDAPPLLAVLARASDLTGVVLELTEHEPFGDLDAVAASLAPWREAGAAIALDDAGAGYAGLQQLGVLRPQLVKLDRSLVTGIDRDPVKQALTESLGAVVGRLDAWLLAEGVERQEELDLLAGLGVPLAQGHLLGRPAPGPAELGVALACHLLGYADRRGEGERVGRLLEPVPAAVGDAAQDALGAGGGDVAVVLDAAGVPRELVLGGRGRRPISLTVLVGEAVGDVARRALTRPEAVRFDPLVCVDDRGLLLGVVRFERLVHALADRRGPTLEEHP